MELAIYENMDKVEMVKDKLKSLVCSSSELKTETKKLLLFIAINADVGLFELISNVLDDDTVKYFNE